MNKGLKKNLLKASACLAALAVVSLLAGCSSKKAVKKDAPPAPVQTPVAKLAKVHSYDEVLNTWTRGVKVYEGIETRLIATVTYKDMAFKKAYIDRYVDSYQFDEDYRKSLMEKEKAAADDSNEFLISVFTPEGKWNDLDAKDSVWRLFLEDDTGRRLVPTSIKKVEKGDAFITEFFPYVDAWSIAYNVKFPKYSAQGKESIPGKDAKFLKLTLTGILGKGEVIWQLKKP